MPLLMAMFDIISETMIYRQEKLQPLQLAEH